MTAAKAKSDKQIDLFAVRSLLFLPASNPRAIAEQIKANSPMGIWMTKEVMWSNLEIGSLQAGIDLGRSAMSWFVPWRVLLLTPYAGAALLAALAGLAMCGAALLLERACRVRDEDAAH